MTLRLDRTLAKKLRVFAAMHDQSLSQVVSDAIEHRFEGWAIWRKIALDIQDEERRREEMRAENDRKFKEAKAAEAKR
ncbi:MAG: hypothetical protein J0L92_29350 [Deltaproteobacteria bacterium]|nr:hypothetical protein [Deltaproteobacteria bacterium]